MTDLSRKVAEIIGWRKVPWGRHSTVWERPTETTREPGGTEPLTEAQYECPDYAHDLNLICSAVQANGGSIQLSIPKNPNEPSLADVCVGIQWAKAWHKEPASAVCLAWLGAKKAGLRALGEE